MATKSAQLLLVYATEDIAPVMKVAAKETLTNSTFETAKYAITQQSKVAPCSVTVINL